MLATEVRTESPAHALALLSEGGPIFICGAISEIPMRSLGVQDFLCGPRSSHMDLTLHG